MKKLLFLNLLIWKSAFALQCAEVTTISELKGAQWASKAAINSGGSAAVVWVKTSGDNQILQAAVRDHLSSRWNSPETVSPPIAIKTISPYVSGDGSMSVLWSSFGPDQKPLWYFSKKNKGAPWSAYALIQVPQYPILWDIDFGAGGTPFYLVSQQERAGLYPIQWDDTPPFMPITPDQVSVPLIVRNRKESSAIVVIKKQLATHIPGTSYVVSGVDDRQFEISHFNESSKKWEAFTPLARMGFRDIHNKNETAKDISAAMNNNKAVAIIWSHYDPVSSKHKLKTLVDKKVEEIAVSADGFAESEIFIDEEGNVVAVWIQTEETKAVVSAYFKPKNKETWLGAPKKLSNLQKQAEHVEISSANGHFVVIWGETEEAPFKRSIYGTTLPASAEKADWTQAVQLSPADQNCWYPSIACNEKEGVITWTTHKRRSSDFLIQAGKLIVQ